MDAYSYLNRGGVFSNAQTGNILLFSVNLTTGNFKIALRYFVPIMAFVVGIAFASILRHSYRGKPHIYWQKTVVLVEALLLFCVAFIPQSLNLLATSLISLACGAQVESFRKIRDRELSIATTMCIGNLRSGVQALCEYRFTKEKRTLENGLVSFAVVLCFAIGAICGNLLLGFLNEKTILVSAVIMLFAFGTMSIYKK